MAVRSVRRLAVIAFVLSAGCNLLSGASDLVAEEEETIPDRPDTFVPPVPEASLPPKLEAGSDADVPTPDAFVDGGAKRPEGGAFAFVTSTTVNGNLEGWVKADETCNSLATAAGLGGSWVAYLSKEGAAAIGGKAADRLNGNVAYYLVDGVTLVATSKNPIANDNLAHGVDRDENGTLVEGTVWTGTRKGEYFYGDCARWTNEGTGAGVIGQTKGRTQDWSSSAPAACNTKHHLYCFEK